MHVLGCIGNSMHVLGCILKLKLFLPFQASACVFYESIDELSARLPNGHGIVVHVGVCVCVGLSWTVEQSRRELWTVEQCVPGLFWQSRRGFWTVQLA